MSKKQKNNKEKTRHKMHPAIIALIIVAGVAVLVGGLFVAVILNKNRGNDITPESSEFSIEMPNIDKYFNENSKVIEVIPVSDADEIYTEEEVIQLLEERGFTDCEITTSYSFEGEYRGDAVISSSSSDKHPVYETYYLVGDELWVISVIEGNIMATPSSYNLAHVENTPVLISESEEIMSYDSSTNSYYRTIPDTKVLDVRVVERIDAKTLESLDLEG